MVKRARPIGGIIRMAALAMLAVLLLGRLGPFCEAAAQATPIASAMAGCDGEAGKAAEKKPSLSACATPCTAVPGDALARVEPVVIPPIAPWSTPLIGLAGTPVSPATPPPQTV